MIRLLCEDKLKKDYLKKAVSDYFNRINKYVKFEILESSNLLDKIKEKEFVICLDALGKKMNSNEFSSFLEKRLTLNSNIVFIIGGSDGIDEEILKRSDFTLSFSEMTFPNQLFRLIFLEQLYRGFKIINNESYHK